MSALMVVALAAIAGPWLIVLAPVVAGLFLLAPPIGIYRHDETPVPRTGVRIEAVPLDDDSANTLRFRLVLINPGDVSASDFRFRLLVPQTLVPASASSRLLNPIHAGAIGQNWFIDSTYDAIAITFRSGKTKDIHCPPGGHLDLADLNLPGQAHPLDVTLDYQISGGNAAPTLDRLHLSSR
jgi:hypothetical protein